eukprot:4156706-Amphidinium_carterae.1
MSGEDEGTDGKRCRSHCASETAPRQAQESSSHCQTEEKGVGRCARALERGDVASSSNSNFRVEGFRGEARERASGELETEAAARASPKRRMAEARGQKRLSEDPDDESRVLDEGERFAQDLEVRAGTPALEDVGAVRVGSGSVDGGGDAADTNMDALPLFAADQTIGWTRSLSRQDVWRRLPGS